MKRLLPYAFIIIYWTLPGCGGFGAHINLRWWHITFLAPPAASIHSIYTPFTDFEIPDPELDAAIAWEEWPIGVDENEQPLAPECQPYDFGTCEPGPNCPLEIL